MIAACPKCQTRYRVEPERLGPDGARLRCSQCSAVFRVRLPAPPSAEPSPPIEAAPAKAVATGAAAAPSGNAALAGIARSAPQAGEGQAARSQGAAERSTSGAATVSAEPRSAGRIAETPNGDAPHFEQARLVLVAHPDPDACKRIAEALEAEGLQVLVAHDGVEAILSIQRALPRAVVLDAALSKMFGFQVCELIKRNESLRVMQVCLMGAIHREDRYRRAPNEIYGADFYVEAPSVPSALVEWLGRIGFDLRGSKQAQAPRPTEAPRSQGPTEGGAHASDTTALGGFARSEPKASGDHELARATSGNQALSAEGRSVTLQHRSTPEAPAPAPQPKPAAIGRIGIPADPLSAVRAQAERLARIIVSDIVLYNEEKFSAAVRSGGVLEAMRDELAEGRSLFRERIDLKVRDERDFLADELVRVARGRGMS